MKGQIFSIDAIFGVIIVLLILGTIATISLAAQKTDFSKMNKTMRKVHDQIAMNLYEGKYEVESAGGNVYCQDYYEAENTRVNFYAICKNW